MKKIILEVMQLDCGSCVKSLEKQFKKIDIKDFKVNLINKQVEVNYDPEVIPQKKLLKAIKHAGFTADVLDEVDV